MKPKTAISGKSTSKTDLRDFTADKLTGVKEKSPVEVRKLLNDDSTANTRPINITLLPDLEASTDFKNNHLRI